MFLKKFQNFKLCKMVFELDEDASSSNKTEVTKHISVE